MNPDERNLLLLLARMVIASRPEPENLTPNDLALRASIARIEAAEDRAADEEKHLGRG